MELPSDELVIVRVLISSYKASSPVSMQAKPLQISHAQWWEKFQPVVGIGELGDLRLSDVELHQDFVLGQRGLLVVLWRLLQELLGWLVAASLASVDLTL